MNISVVGTGYVGLVAGVCFADAGHNVRCVDRDQHKVDQLKKGIIPIYEPGLEDILKPAQASNRIHFTTQLSQSLENVQVVFIAVGTPEKADGSADLGPTFAVVKEIAQAATQPLFVVLKSTVPVGTAKQVQEIFDRESKFAIEVVNNPEFLKEGAAIDDFLKPDRIVIGCRTEAARAVMGELYAPFVKNGHPIIFMDNTSAELTKYAANTFLALKISFINELALLADKVGADINQVRAGFTSDKRICPAFFYPGVGYGGSCFPKDVKALIHTGHKNDLPMKLAMAADEVNDAQKDVLFNQMRRHFGDLKSKRIAVWGLSFKPRTDDIREAPALHLIQQLRAAGAEVQAYDPVGGPNAQQALLPVKFDLKNSAMEALEGADALAIVTEWNEFRSPDLSLIKKSLKSPTVFDGRNVLDPQKMKETGFNYYCIGRQVLAGARGNNS